MNSSVLAPSGQTLAKHPLGRGSLTPKYTEFLVLWGAGGGVVVGGGGGGINVTSEEAELEEEGRNKAGRGETKKNKTKQLKERSSEQCRGTIRKQGYRL